MKRFRFRFKTVLDIKALKEEIKQKEFSEVQRLLREEEGLLDCFVSERRASQCDLASRLSSGISGTELTFYQEHVHALSRAIHAQEEKIALLHQELEGKRIALVEASKEKKIFENLKNRDQNQHRAAVLQEEQKFLDDVTTTHYGKFSHERR